MSESSCTTLGVCQFRYLDNLCLLVAGNDHLGYALAVVDDKLFARQVYESASMVPGLLRTVMPFFRARPLRGLTCAS